MDKSALQLYKTNAHNSANSWLHKALIVDYGRITKVIDIQTVVVEAVVQTSASIEQYTVTLLSLSSALLEISDAPKLGDTVLLFFLRKHDPMMFISEAIHNADATGYNKFSGVGILLSAAKRAASTIFTFREDGEGKPVAELKSEADVSAAFTNTFVVNFFRAVYDSEDERIINLVFGMGRPLVEKHLARIECEHGFWKDPENELVEMDASVTEKYSKYAPVTKDIQGAQTTDVGLGTDKDDAPVETDAPILETIHGKAPITRDIRSPQTLTVGIGNAESGDGGEQRHAPLDVTFGDDAGITLTSGSGLTASIEKDVGVRIGGSETRSVETDREESVTGNETWRVGGNREAAVTGNEKLNVTGNKKETVVGKAEYTSADTDIVSIAPIGLNLGLYRTGLGPYLTAETAAAAALTEAATKAAAQLAILDGFSGGTGFVTGLGAAIIAYCAAVQAADSAAHATVSLAVK